MAQTHNKYPIDERMWWTYPILFLSVIIWGSNFIIGKILVEHFDAYSITIIRLIAINGFLWLFASRYFRMPKGPAKVWVVIALSGIIGIAMNQYTFFLGLVTASPVTSALIPGTRLCHDSHANHFRLRRTERGQVLDGRSAGSRWSGTQHFRRHGHCLRMGEGVIILTMLTFAVFMILIQWMSKYINAIQITLLSNLFGLIILLPFLLPIMGGYGRLIGRCSFCSSQAASSSIVLQTWHGIAKCLKLGLRIQHC
ncbi:EamA family transporter [Salinicoccus sp. CNSTN-B1]